MAEKPSVLFVCVHNAGRSQMAAAFLTDLSNGTVEVRSAGSEPADQVNPAAVAAMAEVGIDIAAEQPKILTTEAVKASDVVITMGCGDTCPVYPGKRYEDWVLDDPAGKGVEAVRPIRDEIRRRVETLISELVPTRASTRTDPTARLLPCVWQAIAPQPARRSTASVVAVDDSEFACLIAPSRLTPSCSGGSPQPSRSATFSKRSTSMSECSE